MPGAVLLVAKNGKVVLEKSYGFTDYNQTQKITPQSVFDLASLTKILATTLAVMKCYEEGLINLNQTLGHYLPECKGTNKDSLPIFKLLLHEAGLLPFIRFYKETLLANGLPDARYYASKSIPGFTSRIASKLYLRNDLRDSFYRKIVQSPVSEPDHYVYSDLDFIFLGKIVEQVSGLTLSQYVEQHFYQPMQLGTICFLPAQHFSPDQIVPSTHENIWRNQLIQADVHDPGAAIMGAVAGHAGLFGSAPAIACLMQMLLNGGEFNGIKYLQPPTIKLFTSYQSWNSRRGLGFDKPERTATTSPAYPAPSASSSCFGHTGFTGTATWADPSQKLVFVFLSNRLMPEDNDALLKNNIRPKLLEAVYKTFSDTAEE